MNKEEKYKKAINELAESYELHLKQWAKRCIDTINEYTTNLQEENERYKNIIEEIQTELFDIKDMIYKPETREENIPIQRKISKIIKRLQELKGE